MIPNQELKPGMCPFCGKVFDKICICGAYHVEENEHELSMQDIYNVNPKEFNQMKKLAEVESK